MTGQALAFMANDRYLDWAKTFLESVRAKDPGLPLYCIPHGGQMDGVLALRRAFGFELLTDGLDRLDPFAERLFPRHPRHRANLRKYAALTLPVDEIAYFDIDMVMLVEPARLFGHIGGGRADLMYFATSPEWVYAAGKLAAAEALFPDMRLISAGAFVTSREALTIDAVISTIEQHMALYLSLRRSKVYDQPVLNFVLHKLGMRCRHITELDGSLAGMASARNPNIGWEDGRIVDRVVGGDLVAVHWAGPAKSRLERLNPRSWPMQRFLQALRNDAERRVRNAAVAAAAEG